MTNTTKPRRCTECSVKLTPKNTEGIGTDLCKACDYIAGLENEHQDGHHRNEAHPECAMCGGDVEIAEAVKAPSTPTGRANMSHKGCEHASTKAARAACRKARAN